MLFGLVWQQVRFHSVFVHSPAVEEQWSSPAGLDLLDLSLDWLWRKHSLPPTAGQRCSSSLNNVRHPGSKRAYLRLAHPACLWSIFEWLIHFSYDDARRGFTENLARLCLFCQWKSRAGIPPFLSALLILEGVYSLGKQKSRTERCELKRESLQSGCYQEFI